MCFLEVNKYILLKFSILFLFIFYIQFSSAQDFIAQKIEDFPLKANQFIGVDKFDGVYYIKENTLFKKNEERVVEYKDFQLGDIYHVDLINPLQITLFYKESNTAIILDNRLNELKRISFDRLVDYKMVDFCTTANEQSLWIFNADLQQLEIFNYQREKTELKTIPITEDVINQKSNFNFCWLQTKNGIYQFNVYGSLIKKIDVKFDNFVIYKNKLLLISKKGESFYFNQKDGNLTSLKLPKIEFNQVHLNNEKLYLYDGKRIHIYQITPNN